TNLQVIGSGINLKLGLIYKLDDNIRYGFALHTPTYYELNEEYWASMSTDFIDEAELINSESYLGSFDYELNTPFKIINSLSFIINKKAIVSVDHEYLNYSTANLASDFTDFSEANKNIKDYYKSTSNLKIGGELRIHPQLSLRGGYAYYGSPFANDYNDASKEYLTMGMGLKINQYFFDLTLVNSVSKEDLFIYDGAPAASINTEKSQLLMSAGFKF
nr:outer membrane protein transport protein [Flavobacteriales bacterium]